MNKPNKPNPAPTIGVYKVWRKKNKKKKKKQNKKQKTKNKKQKTKKQKTLENPKGFVFRGRIWLIWFIENEYQYFSNYSIFLKIYTLTLYPTNV